MQTFKLRGLIAATFTPLDDDGRLRLDEVPAMVDHLLEQGVSGLYVCGSTGEGMSLRSDERDAVTAAFVKASGGRVPVVAQVGHNSLSEARALAARAQEIGVDAVSATCPSYFKVNDVATLIDCMAEVASGAPELPFYYYHIPSLTGSTLDTVDFLRRGSERIANLHGLKYTDTRLFEFQECLELDERRFDVVWGCDEMLLGALATGAVAAIGSTYNVAAPLYRGIIDAFDAGDMGRARGLQRLSVQMVRTMGKYPFHAAMKSVLERNGFSMGGCRLPLTEMDSRQTQRLAEDLEAIGFFQWSSQPGGDRGGRSLERTEP
ncbi:N-acetylneuraminate lyase [Roseiconus nitratireducens]|uniref:N-acetylneuraminate lyase n=1 Tax=Roseiconus nitratireducens TaxID=2605748 RepID=A0A5M6D1N0_9BACT|nr:dihydrodipicolinate synthase family protein [Roseiconus nitratireducens]KAA5540530.1 N-acetylneuraminate lyase [Roseiconus nitratireducens]